MNEENFNEEELRGIIKEKLETSLTIEDALKEKEEEEKLIAESFDVTWSNFNAVISIRKEAIKNLNKAKIRMVVLNFISSIINADAYDEVNNLIELISESTKELKDQKDLINKINNALLKLQAHNVSACNYDMCELLSMLYDKDNAIYHRVVEEIGKSAMRIKCINTMYNDKYDKELDELELSINEHILKLGLSQ